MQELRSTQVLDNEILNDARKKAQSILEKCDFDCKQLLERVDDDLLSAKEKKQEFYDKKIELHKRDLANTIPLEKERFKVSYIQKALFEQFDEYLSTLSEEQKIEILFRKFDVENWINQSNENVGNGNIKSDDKKDTKSSQFTAFVYGLNVQSTQKYLSQKLGKKLQNVEQTEFRKIANEEDYKLKNCYGIILETLDKGVKIRLTINEICEYLFDTYRSELATSLFGGEK